MSPSSSGSWSGSCGGADIIDLDRYMRGNVHPSRTRTGDSKRERLVVDAGGAAACKPCSSASGGDARQKRYWHDSGVDDGSYRQRRTHRPHKRSVQESPIFRYSHEPTNLRKLKGRPSSSSLRAFRSMCEEALRDQQLQIARVAALCERLTEHAEKTAIVLEKTKPPKQIECAAKVERVPSVETSEISSSSRSTRNRKKDLDRSQECKTYRIIMNKLDELNRVFVQQARARPRLPPRAARARTPSSCTSVSVCDKLTATEPQRTTYRVLPPARATRIIQRASPDVARGPASLASTRACAIDIAPRDTRRPAQPNVHTESIVKCESSAEASRHSASGPRCGFNLDHVKRLQESTVSPRRSCSEEEMRARPREGCAPHAGARAPSLCATFRAYWRSLRRYIELVVARTADACDYS